METKELGGTGVYVPVVGMGTGNLLPAYPYALAMADDRTIISSLVAGIELGLTFIDTAELYADGRTEELVGMAIRGRRDKVFLATKVHPDHYTYDGILHAARRSMRRLGTDYIDLYQLHWPSPDVPVGETMRAVEHLVDAGSVRFIGVSNFSVAQLVQAQKYLSKYRIVSNQVKYSLLDRTIENDLLPFAQLQKITLIAYSPFSTGRLFQTVTNGVVGKLASEHRRTVAQICLNWLIAKTPVVALPRGVRVEHLQENAGAAGWRMQAESYRSMDSAFSRCKWNACN